MASAGAASRGAEQPGRGQQSSSRSLSSCTGTPVAMAAPAMSAEEMGSELHDSVVDGDADEAQALLEQGAPVNWHAVSSPGAALSACHGAEGGPLGSHFAGSIAKASHRATVASQGTTALCLAAVFSEEKCVQVLVRYGANLEARNDV